jgi:hypothetical protein
MNEKECSQMNQRRIGESEMESLSRSSHCDQDGVCRDLDPVKFPKERPKRSGKCDSNSHFVSTEINCEVDGRKG